MEVKAPFSKKKSKKPLSSIKNLKGKCFTKSTSPASVAAAAATAAADDDAGARPCLYSPPAADTSLAPRPIPVSTGGYRWKKPAAAAAASP